MENEQKPVQPLSQVKVSSWVLRRWKVLLLLLLALFLISSFRFWDSKGSKDSLSGQSHPGRRPSKRTLRKGSSVRRTSILDRARPFTVRESI